VANKKRKNRGDNPVRSVRAVGEYIEGVGALNSWYMAGKTVKKKTLPQPPDADTAWILEYYHEVHKKWLYMDRGRGVPFGPWKEERALYEMVQWVKATANNKPDWAKESIEWRIRNIETNEIVLHHIIA